MYSPNPCTTGSLPKNHRQTPSDNTGGSKQCGMRLTGNKVCRNPQPSTKWAGKPGTCVQKGSKEAIQIFSWFLEHGGVIIKCSPWDPPTKLNGQNGAKTKFAARKTFHNLQISTGWALCWLGAYLILVYYGI